MDNEELERTNLMKTMLIEVDEEESIDENIEQFEEKLEYILLFPGIRIYHRKMT